MEQHCDHLAKLCRVCSENISKHRVIYDCAAKADNLAKYLHVDIDTSNPAVHPTKFCQKCYSGMKRMKKSDTKTSIRVTFWTEHTETDCDTCKRYNDTCKPGRKVKAQKGGKHVQVTNGQILVEINSLNLLPQFATKMPLSKSRFSVPPAPIKLEDFTCECCGDVLNQPVETKCRHIMCKHNYIKEYLNTIMPSMFWAIWKHIRFSTPCKCTH